MFIACVTVKVKEGFAEKFIEATLENARCTRKEPGNARFDLLRSEDDENRFFLYEVYRQKEDFAKHQQAEHYLKWKSSVAEWMAEPRQGPKHRNIFPNDEEW